MPSRNHEPERTCIVTREALPVDRLIRFVASPDGEVVPDLRRRLPGRGVWVSAAADHVAAAERKRLFARGLGDDVKVAPGLADRVGTLLRQAALAALSLARKAGTLVTGFAKVEAALAEGNVVGLIQATEAGEDGVAKIEAAARRHLGDRAIGLARIGIFRGEELDLALGRPNVIHAALLAGPASTNALKRVRALADFLGEDKGVGGIAPGRASAGNVSAEIPGNR